MRNTRSLLSVLVSAVLLASAAAADTGSQPVAKEMLLNGAEAPSGSTLFTDSVLTTLEKAATVNLVNGQTVVLAPNSAASFEAVDSGDIYVSVAKGSASYRGADGVVIAALENEFLVASQDGVRQGDPVEQDESAVPVCLLTSPTDAAGAKTCLSKPKKNGCSWSREKAVVSDLEAQGAKFYQVDEDFDCKDRKGWIALLGAGAVGAGGGTGLAVAGAVLGSAVVINQVDETNSSPVRPGG